jgi:hypothetical protein
MIAMLSQILLKRPGSCRTLKLVVFHPRESSKFSSPYSTTQVPLNIAIVGAGIADTAAATCLAQKGHCACLLSGTSKICSALSQTATCVRLVVLEELADQRSAYKVKCSKAIHRLSST